MMLALTAESMLLDGLEIAGAVVLIEDARVRAIGSREALEVPHKARLMEFGDALLAPGLLDVHVHGGAGQDFMSADSAGLAAIRAHLARHGVTRYLATTMTAGWEQTLEVVARLAQAGLELHLEGPFLNPKRRGAHPPEYLLEPSLEKLDQLCEAAHGQIRLITIAPELPHALEFIREATARGIGISLGHSDSTLEQALAGVAAGARHVTHTFNAMAPLQQRHPGLLGLALTEPGLWAEIIADGVHVHPRLVGAFCRLKPEGKAILASDGISAAGCGDGMFQLGPIQVRVMQGRCESNGSLAGSVLTLDGAVQNVMNFARLGVAEALTMATRNPATLLRVQPPQMAVGSAADITVWTRAGALRATFLAGQQVH
ncbi:MAG TPA: N-acetylglucosamine-6-phosphate deacetylase [Terriglobales bacterium]|nr:N-acetylglucosamine-6-phosphate deacetylase [Terriglobales bacterium]